MNPLLSPSVVFLLFCFLPQYEISSDELPSGIKHMNDYYYSDEITTADYSKLSSQRSEYTDIFPNIVPSNSIAGSEHGIKKNHLTVDFSFILLSLEYARRGIRPKWYYGIGAGIGDGLGFMFLGSRHYSDPNWLSYEERDGYYDKLLFDVLHVKIFSRYQPSEGWHFDFGLHLSVFFHYDSSDDDPSGGECIAAYVNPTYGWHHFKIGPRVVLGRFAGCGDEEEFGIKISPLIGRVLLDW